jgi:hypothetical protein
MVIQFISIVGSGRQCRQCGSQDLEHLEDFEHFEIGKVGRSVVLLDVIGCVQ